MNCLQFRVVNGEGTVTMNYVFSVGSAPASLASPLRLYRLKRQAVTYTYIPAAHKQKREDVLPVTKAQCRMHMHTV